MAFLRRQEQPLLALATNLSETDLGRKRGDSVDVMVIASSDPLRLSLVDRTFAEAHARVTFLAGVPATPSLLSVEIPTDGPSMRSARTRFGIRSPQSLEHFGADSVAISDPILLIVPAGSRQLPLDADSAVALMRGSTNMSAGTTEVGVYWETYGFDARDSLDVAVTIRGGATPVMVSWKEPQRGRPTRTMTETGSGVPIQMRSVILDIETLPRGAYTVEITVGRPRGAAVTSRRAFVLR
jgi:hypothetical protein